jgi:hypothetical protein
MPHFYKKFVFEQQKLCTTAPQQAKIKINLAICFQAGIFVNLAFSSMSEQR